MKNEYDFRNGILGKYLQRYRSCDNVGVMNHVIILIGLPASGKSTYARKLMEEKPGFYHRVNRDDIRSMLNCSYSKSNEELVRSIQNEMIVQNLKAGNNLIIDNTHLVPATLKKLHTLLESIGDVKVTEKVFNVPLSECLQRNALREGSAKVPEKAILGMAKSAGLTKDYVKLQGKEVIYPKKVSSEPIKQDPSLPKAIITDLDGTLALIGDRSPYDASRCDEVDFINQPVLECIFAMHKNGHEVIFMSGREDKHRAASERFISKHWPFLFQLFMRETGDKRSDVIVKRELFDKHIAGKYFVQFALDDRTKVVRDCWRAMGLATFQVADGDF